MDPESPYWGFRDLDGLDPETEQDVEIRIDVPQDQMASLRGQSGWRVQLTESDGTVYLRRKQKLTDEAVLALLVDALTLASAHSGRFHSWLHGPGLDDDG